MMTDNENPKSGSTVPDSVPESPRNTSADDALSKFLVGAMPHGIEEQERAGQREMVASTTLPRTNLADAEFVALGFTFGEQVANDPLFRQATLPDGWTREGSDHDMWSYICDGRGVRRVAVFYKAAFYDREAFMSIIDVGAKFAREHIYGDKRFTVDERLTPAERASAVESAERYIADAEQHPDIYADRLPRAWQLIHGLSA